MHRRTHILLASLIIAGLIVGCSSNESPAPLMPPAPVVDTAPPAPPSHVVCVNENDNVKVAWSANVSDPDFAGFRLDRIGAGHTVTLIEEPRDVDRYVDDHPFEGVATYRVIAVDASGNESAAATVTHDYFGDPPPRRAIH